MRYAKRLIALLSVLLAVSVLMLILRGNGRGAATARLAAPPTAVAAPPPKTAAATAEATGAVAAVRVEPGLLQTPQALAYFEREAFEQQARRFFDTAAQLDPAAREREAAGLEQAVDRYEAARQLSAGEAMNLRLGLIQATVADEVERGARQAELIARYRQDGARREAQFMQQQAADAAFADYKRREAQIVTEVMALPQIPDGLTREEYLRRRLQRERERAAGQP
ncbi:hypothetical protein [Tahibacter harae]|uniref:Lipase chaperone n=1 Tax=Tahibacter harae TaxID=2963937 RepID=A0ABT1QRZ9_9GAMM|nr:hypothetical protein [Tahibacter harae]MCQ4165059.1 hypothetical protein [Tahibacter harae]